MRDGRGKREQTTRDTNTNTWRIRERRNGFPLSFSASVCCCNSLLRGKVCGTDCRATHTVYCRCSRTDAVYRTEQIARAVPRVSCSCKAWRVVLGALGLPGGLLETIRWSWLWLDLLRIRDPHAKKLGRDQWDRMSRDKSASVLKALSTSTFFCIHFSASILRALPRWGDGGSRGVSESGAQSPWQSPISSQSICSTPNQSRDRPSFCCAVASARMKSYPTQHLTDFVCSSRDLSQVPIRFSPARDHQARQAGLSLHVAALVEMSKGFRRKLRRPRIPRSPSTPRKGSRYSPYFVRRWSFPYKRHSRMGRPRATPQPRMYLRAGCPPYRL